MIVLTFLELNAFSKKKLKLNFKSIVKALKTFCHIFLSNLKVFQYIFKEFKTIKSLRGNFYASLYLEDQLTYSTINVTSFSKKPSFTRPFAIERFFNVSFCNLTRIFFGLFAQKKVPVVIPTWEKILCFFGRISPKDKTYEYWKM